MISRRTVSPPTPESKTPIGRGSDTDSLLTPGADRHARRAHQLGGDAADVPAHGGIRVGQHERHALVVRAHDQLAVGDDAVFGHPTEGALEVVWRDPAG